MSLDNCKNNLVRSKHLKQLWRFRLRVEKIEKKERMLFFGLCIIRKNQWSLWPFLSFHFFCMYVLKPFFCLFFGFQIDCDEEGARIVRCSTKSKNEDDKKVLPSLALVLWLPPCHHLCHHRCTIRRNVRKMNPHNHGNTRKRKWWTCWNI